MDKNNINNQIQKITDKIKKEIKPEKIILFGSFAWGEPHEDSDLDLFVIEKSKLSKRKRQINIRRLFLDFEMPADALSFTPEEINARKKKNDLFIIDVLTKGKVLYERN